MSTVLHASASDVARFEAKYIPEPNTGCWLWTASKLPQGYGQFFAAGRRQLAHRWAYEAAVGPVPEGLELDHLCRTRQCVNPQHLEPVTGRENRRRGMSPPARCARQTHCVHGHPFDDANTYRPPSGERKCKTCRRAVDSKRRARRAGKAVH